MESGTNFVKGSLPDNFELIENESISYTYTNENLISGKPKMIALITHNTWNDIEYHIQTNNNIYLSSYARYYGLDLKIDFIENGFTLNYTGSGKIVVNNTSFILIL